MPKISLRWLVKCIIIIALFARILTETTSITKDSLERLRTQKSTRSILLKRYPFLKNIPLSKDMISLINEHHNRPKRQRQFDNPAISMRNGRTYTRLKRKKQKKNAKNLHHSFSIKNLNIFQIPPGAGENPKNSLYAEDQEEEGSSTVKPVVIFNNFLPPQIPMDGELNEESNKEDDLSDNLEYDDQYYDDNVILPNAPPSHFLQTDSTTKTTSSVATTSTETSNTSTRTTREAGKKCGNFFNQKAYKRFVEDVAKKVAQQINPKRNIRKSQTEQESNSERDQAFFERILGEVETVQKLTSLNKNEKPGFSCHVNGSWITTAGGMRIDISMTGNNTGAVTVAEKNPSTRLVRGFLEDTKWSFSAQFPFPRSGIIILSGFHNEDKRVAAFIGECRCCESTEMITGHWLLARTSHDCKDLKATQQLISDVWRREKLHVLRAIRLAELHLTEKPNNFTSN